MTLANNEDVELLSTRDYKEKGFKKRPEWPDQLWEVWSEPIEDPDQFEKAFEAVYNWRVEVGLQEDLPPPQVGRPNGHKECAWKTKALFYLYESYI